MDERGIRAIYERQVDTVYRVCYGFMGNAADSEDAVQETFVRMIRSEPAFESEEHEKAWLIRVASNVCKDLLKAAARKTISLEETSPEAEGALSASDKHDETLDAVMRLDEKYRDLVYLHYYEGYKTDEIAVILARPPSTVRNQLREARELLRKELGGEGT